MGAAGEASEGGQIDVRGSVELVERLLDRVWSWSGSSRKATAAGWWLWLRTIGTGCIGEAFLWNPPAWLGREASRLGRPIRLRPWDSLTAWRGQIDRRNG